MLTLAIGLLWLLVYALIFCGVVWLVLYGIKTFISPIPSKVENGIWFIILLLIIIAVLTALAGNGSNLRSLGLYGR